MLIYCPECGEEILIGLGDYFYCSCGFEGEALTEYKEELLNIAKERNEADREKVVIQELQRLLSAIDIGKKRIKAEQERIVIIREKIDSIQADKMFIPSIRFEGEE